MTLFNFKNITYSLGSDLGRRISVAGSVNAEEVLVVRGPSGAGKSTLLRVLAKLQPCQDGEAFLKGESWLQIPGTAWRANVHYLAQKPALFDGTVADNLAKPFETRMLNQKRFNSDLARATMDDLLMTHVHWEQDARTLSGGEAARLAFVRSMLIDPVVLLLDEPTAALDEKSQEAFYRVLSKWLAAPDRAAILISHNNDYRGLQHVSYLDIIAAPGGV